MINENADRRWERLIQNYIFPENNEFPPKSVIKPIFWKLNVFVFNENGDPIAD